MIRLILIYLLLITTIGCSNNNNFSKEALRNEAMKYCESNGDSFLYDYYRAYNSEIVNSNTEDEYGAFEQFHIISDSQLTNLNQNKKGSYLAETSVMISNSKALYKEHIILGKIFQVGIQFEINHEGQVCGHREFLIFWNDKKEYSNKSTINYVNKVTKEGAYAYLKDK